MKSYVVLAVLLIMMIVPVSAQDSTLGVTPEVIAAYPEPNIIPLIIDDNLLYDRVYRRVEGSLALYDAAGGNLVNDMGVGYNYVTLSGAMTQGDWTQISDEHWIATSTMTENVAISRYAGVRLPEEGLAYPMAWTLRHLRPSETPGGEESDNNPFMYRYTRVSL